jgi:hypothetical protein
MVVMLSRKVNYKKLATERDGKMRTPWGGSGVSKSVRPGLNLLCLRKRVKIRLAEV